MVMVLPDSLTPATDGAATLEDLLRQRRTIRRLGDGPLPDGALARIATAAHRVPAAYGRPAWHVVVVRESRAAFWDAVEAAFRERLEPERLARYLDRLDGFRAGAGAVLVYEDRLAVEASHAANGVTPEQAAAFAQQGLGMVQFALWLALVAEGLATSLQHWEWLVEDRLADLLGVPADRYRLAATMPFGFTAEEPRPAADTAPVVSFERFAGPDSLGG